MTYIIAEPCVGVCDTACVEVCPVDCIHFTQDDIGETAKEKGFDPEGKQLFIDPDECIDCSACISECPVDAIYEDEDTCISDEGNDKSVIKNYKFFDQEWDG